MPTAWLWPAPKSASRVRTKPQGGKELSLLLTLRRTLGVCKGRQLSHQFLLAVSAMVCLSLLSTPWKAKDGPGGGGWPPCVSCSLMACIIRAAAGMPSETSLRVDPCSPRKDGALLSLSLNGQTLISLIFSSRKNFRLSPNCTSCWSGAGRCCLRGCCLYLQVSLC